MPTQSGLDSLSHIQTRYPPPISANPAARNNTIAFIITSHPYVGITVPCFNRSATANLSDKLCHVAHATSPLRIVDLTAATPCLDVGFDFLQRLPAVLYGLQDAFPRPVKAVAHGNIQARILLKHRHFQVSHEKGQRTVQRKIDRFTERVRAKDIISVRDERCQSRRFQQGLERD